MKRTRVKLKLMGIAVCSSILLFISLKKGILPENKKPVQVVQAYNDRQVTEDIGKELVKCYTESDLLWKYYSLCLKEYKECKRK